MLSLPDWSSCQQVTPEQLGEVSSFTAYFPEPKAIELAQKKLTGLNGVLETNFCRWHSSIGVRYLSNVTCAETILQFLTSQKITAEKSEVLFEELNTLCETKLLPESSKPVHIVPSTYDRNKQILYQEQTTEHAFQSAHIDVNNPQPIATTGKDGEPLYQNTDNTVADQERYGAAKLAWKQQIDSKNATKEPMEIIKPDISTMTPEQEQKIRNAKVNYLNQSRSVE